MHIISIKVTSDFQILFFENSLLHLTDIIYCLIVLWCNYQTTFYWLQYPFQFKQHMQHYVNNTYNH